jgi:amino acid adenylation domain-containing protein
MFLQYILQPIIDSCKTFAKNNAFCINAKFYTYIDFAKHITKIRKAVQTSETKTANIGLVVNDDIETYASIFAIWMDGYVYIPIHPQEPLERSMEIITEADVDLILDSSIKTKFSTRTIINSSLLTFEEINLKPKSIPDDALAYILFTSGSTGKPKGVQITRGNIGSFMKAFWEVGFHIDQNDRCLQCFDLTFDVSVQSYLVPLTKGACTYTIPHDQIKYSYVFGLLEDHKLTFGAMAPSMIRYLQPYFDEINIPDMRYNILTAEASPLDLIIEWSKCIPNAEIYDFYGPTETTIYCTYNKFFRVVSNKQLNGMLSIGKPMSGLKAIIIDDEKRILGKNQKGELCISGGQITSGYWKNNDKNIESFFEIKEENTIRRFYRTGDSCYFDDDMDIMLEGRLDHQVKIQGYRVELGEIEYHAREFLSGQNAIAVTFSNQNSNNEIALFIEGELPNDFSLLEYLKRKMPFYMIPSKIIVKEKLPLNASGKTDRIALKNLIQ